MRRLISLIIVVPTFILTPPSVRAHSIEEIKAAFAKMEEEPSGEILELTRVYEAMKDLDLGIKAHKAQHDLLHRAQRRWIKKACVELIERGSSVDREIGQLKREEKLTEVEALEKERDKINALVHVNCNFIN